MAVWDAVAKIEGKPLYRVLADRYSNGVADDKVWVYAAGGYYYPGKDTKGLQDEFRSYRERGYRVCKMKIGGASLDEDIRRIEARARDRRRRPEPSRSTSTAASTSTPRSSTTEALKPYNLFWYEEVGDPLDYALNAEIAKHYPLPMATGENLFSHQGRAQPPEVSAAMRKDIDFLQFDCALSYGLVEYLRTLEVVKEEGWSTRRIVPHGGHQMSLAIAAGLHLGGNESYPDVFKPFCGLRRRLRGGGRLRPPARRPGHRLRAEKRRCSRR